MQGLKDGVVNILIHTKGFLVFAGATMIFFSVIS